MSCAVNTTADDNALSFLRTPCEDGLNTYLIVDPTLRKAVSGIFDLDVLDVKSLCLFNGRAAEENEEVAPYLVDATVPAADQVPRFNRTFIQDHWGQSTGIIIRSHAKFEEVRKHFRRFTKLKREGRDGWVFFRFWDPRIASVYFRTIQKSASRAEQWFGRGLIDSYVIEEEGGAKASTFRATDSFEGSNEPILSVALTDWEMRPFQLSAYDRDVVRIASDLKNDFRNELRSYSTDNIAEFIKPTLSRFAEMGFRRKENLHVIAAWGLFYGTDFIDKDAQGTLAEICKSDSPEAAKFKALKTRMAEFGHPEAPA
ncbi:MAG: DUF4123 domain-containing protein [Pseudomonadota bacterium]